MESKQFISLLKHPKELSAIDFAEVQQYAQQYPFASIVHTLVAKKAYTEKPHEYDYFLTKAAMHALDRKKLYYIIHEEKLGKKKYEEKVEEVEVLTETPVVIDTLKEPIIETIHLIEPEKEEDSIPFVNGSFTPIKEEKDVQPEVKIDEPVKEPEVISEENEEKKHKKKKEKQKKKHKKEEQIDANAQFSFTDWLKQVDKKKAPPVEDEDEEDDLEEQYHAGKFEAQLHKQIAEEPEAIMPVPKIPANWKKSSDVKAEVKISDLAQKSIQRDDNTITETLAKILELQKHYGKAIEAYEKLSLKYPEKSSYFATRILELKKKI